nr:unnamed protein product [Spirometra erinaceieuropaei]
MSGEDDIGGAAMTAVPSLLNGDVLVVRSDSSGGWDWKSWPRALDDRHAVHIAFIDFQKAFDTVPHQRLLHNLKKMGIGGNLLKWIENFLVDRHQVLCIGRGKSDPAMVDSVVPQGSVLGPILFLIYVDNAARDLDCEVAMFADDMKIWSVIRCPADEDRLQMNLNRLEAWSNRWLLRFNVAKCSILRLGNTVRSASTRGYFLGGAALQEVEAQKDLGVLTTSSLKPSAYCSRVAKSAMSVLYAIKPTLTTDRGSPFHSSLFREFTRLLGCAHITTTAYHPASNGLVERLHRQLKSSLMSQTDAATLSLNLPLVLLGIRSSVKEDIQCTAAELVYGTPLRLPGEFVQPSTTNTNITSTFVQQLKQRMAQLRPTPTRLTSKHVFVHEDLKSAPFVFVRHDAVRQPLCPPYDGPYKVVQRKDKFYVLQKADKTDAVSIDRLKPAYLECLPSTSAPSIPPTMSSPDTPTPFTYPPSPHLTILPTQPDPPPSPPPISSRSGRHIRFFAKLKDFVV